MESLTWQSWLTLAIVGGMFASLMLTRIKAEVAFLSAMALLFVCGILDVRGGVWGLLVGECCCGGGAVCGHCGADLYWGTQPDCEASDGCAKVFVGCDGAPDAA